MLSRESSVRRVALAVIVGVTLPSPAALSAGATDPRFFGIYCGDATVRACGKFCLTSWGPCFEDCENVEIESLRISVQYKETPGNPGSILGSGTATVRGKALKLNVSAVVTGFGRAKGVVASNRFDPESGTAELAGDGVTLRVSAMGQSIEISKMRCGNAPPRVRIAAPANGSTLVFRTPTLFRGEVTDDKDNFVPQERMGFASDRDGPLSGVVNAQPMSLELTTDALSQGSHRVSFSATDSGGLTSSTSIAVTVASLLRYAAKFVCGKAPDDSAARGSYFTSINVHNPSDGAISFRKRISVGLAEQKPGPLTRHQPAQLDPARAFRVECPEILRTVGAAESFLEGFLIIETPDPLNVVAVYSAAGQSGFVETLHVLPVAGSRTVVKLPDLVVEGGCDLSVRVRNVGAGDAPASTTKLAVDGQVFKLPTPPIQAGGVAALPPVNAQHSGDFGFALTADSEGRVVESSEANNVTVVNCIG